MKTKKLIPVILAAALALNMYAQDQKKEGTAYLVSNAHFDTQWLWTVQTSIDEYLKNTMEQNIYLLERYPEYIFNFEGGIKYAWMKEYYPLQYEKVSNYIRQGRWHISGASWDATDPNIPSPESFIRNIMHGQNFYKKEFGVHSTDIFLPDCFGFGYILPTVASHCGLIGFSTQKLQWRQKPFYGDSKVPFKYGLWQGIDGSRIFAMTDCRNYTKKYNNGDLSLDKEVIDIVRNSPNNKGVRYFGTGDRGGAPTVPSVDAVVEGIRKGRGPIDIRCVASDELMKEYMPFSEHPELPVYDGELLMDVHGTGCYTSQAAMKCYNRANEILGDAAERASVVAEWLGADYPSEKIAESWQRFIWHQFHDDLTGTSIPAVYPFSWNDELISQTQFADVLTNSSKNVVSLMNTSVSGVPVVVFNSLGRGRKDAVIANVPMASKPSSVQVVSNNGKRVNAQLLSYNDGMAEVLFMADVAPMSYSVYEVRPASNASLNVLKAGNNWIENSVYKVTLDENGDIASIFDKRYGRELVEKGHSMRIAAIEGNESFDWPAWEILKKVIDTPSKVISGNVRISVAEKGKARVALKVEKSFGDSEFEYFISLTDGGADDRIDVAMDIDWRQENTLLKAEFPMAVANAEATYDLGLGTIRRGNNTETAYEVPAYQWADITAEDNSYGVSIISDYKVGWDKPADNMLRLTLLHTPGVSKGYKHSKTQDFGHHSLTYSIVGHAGDPKEAGITAKADAKNNRLYAFNTRKHKGVLGKEFSMLKVCGDGIEVKAFKKAENADEYIIRIYETAGKDVKDAVIEFAASVVEAYMANGIEEHISGAKFEGNKLYVSTTAYSPRTYAIKLAPSGKQAVLPNCTKLSLDYNIQGYTVDSYRDVAANALANIDGKGSSYAYELLPKELVADGIPFSFGEFGYNNVVRCDGRTLILPEGNARTLYLLAASTNGDKTVEITAGDKTTEYSVPYYSGYYGQWGWVTETGEGYIKDASLAYVGTHRHNTKKGNESYVFTYMYKIAVPIADGVSEVRLPDDPDILIFAATLSDEDASLVTPANEFRAIP